MPGKERKLKIVPKYFPRRWKDVVFPEIRLSGKWLQDLGFTCGNFVVITQGESSITITALPEVKAEPQPIKKNACKAKPVFSPEIDSLPGNQLFNVLSAEAFREYLAKNKEEKERREKRAKERAVENYEKEWLKANSQTPQEPAADQKIIQLQPEVKPISDDQIMTLHPQPSQAADGCDYFTIA